MPRKCVRLTEAQWIAAQQEYEAGTFTHPQIAARYGCSLRTVENKAAQRGWKRTGLAVKDAHSILREVTTEALRKSGEQLAERLTTSFEQEMAPWFEREKRLHIQDTIRRAKLRQKLADKLVEDAVDLSPKDAAFIAKIDDTYDQMKRRNLGLNEGMSVGGALNVSILANQAAIGISAAPSQS
jgi:hypothetical protein